MSERIGREVSRRTPRAQQTREFEGRDEYVPPSTLPTPDPQPGWRFRWIATSVLNQANSQNVSRKMREGWEPVRAEDHPELMLPANATGNVENGGLMLCKIPEQRVLAREAYYNRLAAHQSQAVDNNYSRVEDSRMPLFIQKRSDVKFGSGSN